MDDGDAAGPARVAETREAIVARVVREQAELNPSPVYTAASKRRLRTYLKLIGPIGIAVGWALGRLFGWNTLEWVGFGVGFAISLGYLGFVFVAERDDGRIHRSVRRVAHPDGDGPEAPAAPDPGPG